MTRHENGSKTRLRVLVVDDDDLLRRATVRFLRATDVVVEVEDLLAGEALARGGAPYHVAILDVHMPGWTAGARRASGALAAGAGGHLRDRGPDTKTAERARVLRRSGSC